MVYIRDLTYGKLRFFYIFLGKAHVLFPVYNVAFPNVMSPSKDNTNQQDDEKNLRLKYFENATIIELSGLESNKLDECY